MHLLVLTAKPDGGRALLPALELLDHTLGAAPMSGETPPLRGVDLVLVDATADLGTAAHACRTLAATDGAPPTVVVVPEAGLAALKTSWGLDDWLLPTAGPAEVETRLRLALERTGAAGRARAASVGQLTIDEDTYVVRLRGTPLDLTFREFELLKFLAGNPGRVFTRAQLLQEVWGYDYFGGTRTVDVHIRRLRAKLGAEYESVIVTVRGVGYKLDPHGAPAPGGRSGGRPDGSEGE